MGLLGLKNLSVFIILSFIFLQTQAQTPSTDYQDLIFDLDYSSNPYSETTQPASVSNPPPAIYEANPSPEVPRTIKNISILPGSRSLPHGPAVTWNGCDKNVRVQSGLDLKNCSQWLLHPTMAKQMEGHLFRCASEAANKVGLRGAEKIYLTVSNTYRNTNVAGSNRISLHAYARAMDINKISYLDKNNKIIGSFSSHVRDFQNSTTNQIMYNKFRECWRQSLGSKCLSRYSREHEGSIGIPGSDLGGNNAHLDHIHLSTPDCVE